MTKLRVAVEVGGATRHEGRARGRRFISSRFDGFKALSAEFDPFLELFFMYTLNMNEIYLSRAIREEALSLSSEILKDIELSRIPLSNIGLKTTRLARIIGDFETEEILKYEVSGYPTKNNRIATSHIFNLAVKSGRAVAFNDVGKPKSVRGESIETLEINIATAQITLEAVNDPDISIANPNQYVSPVSFTNRIERNEIRQTIIACSKILANTRSIMHDYALLNYFKFQFSEISYDIFVNIRERVDATINNLIPEAVKRFVSIYENLSSDNPEDWSNAVASCRRILKDLADALFPAQKAAVEKERQDEKKEFQLGEAQYINRLIAYIESNSSSEKYEKVVGSHLKYIGERLDSVYESANKGVHETIIDRTEAERYVIYTYLLVGDILSLVEDD